MARRQREILRQIQFPEGIVKVIQEHEPIMVSVRQKQLIERGNPSFWHPQWEEVYKALTHCPSIKKLDSLIDFITYGQVGERARYYDSNGDVLYATPKNIPPSCTGVDPYLRLSLTKSGSSLDAERSRVQVGDVLLVRNGITGIGRCVVFTDNVKLRYKLNIDQNIALLRLAKGMVPEYVAIAILTRFVQTQIQRFIAGVGAPTIDFAEIRSLLVPIMDKEIQQSISKLYRLISSFHNDAMEAKATSKVGEAIRNLQIAEGMLETLIWQVEKLIEGERERITPLLPEEASERFRNVLIEEYRRIGELHQQLEGERKRGRVLGIPMERYPEVAEEIERVLRFVEATLPEEERVE